MHETTNRLTDPQTDLLVAYMKVNESRLMENKPTQEVLASVLTNELKFDISRTNVATAWSKAFSKKYPPPSRGGTSKGGGNGARHRMLAEAVLAMLDGKNDKARLLAGEVLECIRSHRPPNEVN